MAALAISAEEARTVSDILARCLPDGYRVYAFGSRATGIRLKPWSDLDLSIEGPAPLPPRTLAQLGDAFDESLLMWKVDVVDRTTVSESFGRIIDADKVPL